MCDDGIHGMEPWFSDGSLAGPMADEGRLFGTHMLQDINPGSGSSGLGMGFTKGLGGSFFGSERRRHRRRALVAAALHHDE